MSCETWVGAGFGEVLVDAMRRDDPEDVVRTNACNHWLPATVRLAIRCESGNSEIGIIIDSVSSYIDAVKRTSHHTCQGVLYMSSL